MIGAVSLAVVGAVSVLVGAFVTAGVGGVLIVAGALVMGAGLLRETSR